MKTNVLKKPSTIWILVLVVLGVAIAWIAVRELQNLKHLQPVVVVTKDIPALTQIKDGDLAIREVPQDLIPSDALTDPALAQGKYTSAALFAGQSVSQKAVTSSKSLRSVIRQFGLDYDGITIQLDQADLVPTNVSPGDTVDVVGIVGNGNVITSSMIAENVPVLSVSKDDRKILIAAPRSKSTELAKNLAVGKIRVFLSPQEYGDSPAPAPTADTVVPNPN